MERSDSRREASGGDTSPPSPREASTSSGRIQFPPLRYFHSPLSSLLEYSGYIRLRQDNSGAETLTPAQNNPVVSDLATALHGHSGNCLNNNGDNNNGEVAIRIIGGSSASASAAGDGGRDDDEEAATSAALMDGGGEAVGGGSDQENNNSNNNNNNNSNSRDNAIQRYDIQQVARWIEQVLPFSLLLLVVFIRQHLQGFFVTIWITAFLFKSNEIVRKQTALKGERKLAVLIGYFLVFVLHVFGFYWWYRNDDLYYPLFMVPPKAIPPFWHAVFIILVNDTMMRQAAMALKLVLLMYYKNGRGHNFRRQGQMLTLVEYTLLLYRALLPTPVWYRFFLNKEYGSLFSSLTTGLCLTFKLTSIVEKVQSFFAALKALSRKEIHYGSHATQEQVNAVGDLCAICQEKMHTPILLRCKHIFCEDCVSEWFERERTCPLCRALVRPADLRSFGDGSTSLFFQIF